MCSIHFHYREEPVPRARQTTGDPGTGTAMRLQRWAQLKPWNGQHCGKMAWVKVLDFASLNPQETHIWEKRA